MWIHTVKVVFDYYLYINHSMFYSVMQNDFFMARRPLEGQTSSKRFFDHTQALQTWVFSSRLVIDQSQIPLTDNTQHSNETHTPAGFEFSISRETIGRRLTPQTAWQLVSAIWVDAK